MTARRAGKRATIEPVVLITGFEPFDGERINPSKEIVRRLDRKSIAGHRVVGRILPVVFGETGTLLASWIDELHPAVVLALGQAGGRAELSLERVAINLIDARIADNAGAQPIDAPVVAGGLPAHFSQLPVKAMLAAIRARGIPATASFSAGTYVCNQVFYLVCDLLSKRSPRAETMRGGFMHVPWLPAQARNHPGQPSMALSAMLTGVRAAIECAATTPVDDEVVGGQTH
ncbi:MAG: pyroglutamyl-peptidase I [Dokdonella sp.]